MISATEAKKKLIEGNQKYLDAKAGTGDISKALRLKTAEHEHGKNDISFIYWHHDICFLRCNIT